MSRYAIVPAGPARVARASRSIGVYLSTIYISICAHAVDESPIRLLHECPGWQGQRRSHLNIEKVGRNS